MFRSAALTLALCLATITAHASPVSGQGTWETTLQGRAPLTPGGTDYQAYYDTDLNITWLANANLAATDTFGVAGICTDNTFPCNGPATMAWNTAQTWIAAMNSENHLGVNNWRLPIIIDTDGPDADALGNDGCDDDYPAGDCGYNVDLATSEMASMYYRTLGNTAAELSSGLQVCCCTHPDYCLSNKGPFSNLQPYFYWSGTEYAPDPSIAWFFSFSGGRQAGYSKTNGFYAWPVRPGDIAVVPAPAAVWLLGTALAGLGGRQWMRRRLTA